MGRGVEIHVDAEHPPRRLDGHKRRSQRFLYLCFLGFTDAAGERLTLPDDTLIFQMTGQSLQRLRRPRRRGRDEFRCRYSAPSASESRTIQTRLNQAL